MELVSLSWAAVALCAIFATWDTFYRYFRHRAASAIEERVDTLEKSLREVSEQAKTAEDYTRSVANRLQTVEAPNRWRRP